MESSEQMPVILSKEGISIHGRKELLLCASLFYFRIPGELWRDRIKKLKQTGYHCADVYFPWNYHEKEPGVWSFEGDKDVEEFLSIMAQEEVYVIARPGPYICSEWDGGSIPGWITGNDWNIRLDDSRWLDAVEVWYSKILPILSRFQLHKNGSIIMLQIENELDFFDCKNPKAYMEKLASSSRKHGIEVPIFGCAGQGSVQNATGWANDVAPTYNFYPLIEDTTFDSVVLSYHEALQEINLPLLITETGREHFLLRREMANGARLLGAYNQVAGTNFGFTTSINNWGKKGSPLSFLATDYDFDSMISASGKFRPEAKEARLLAGLIDTFGESLAASQIRRNDSVLVSWLSTHQNPLNTMMLDMESTGVLINVPNYSKVSEKVQLQFPEGNIIATIGSYCAPFIPWNISLQQAGCKAKLMFSNAEILCMKEGELCLYADEEPEAVFCSETGEVITIQGFGSHTLRMNHKDLLVEILNRIEAGNKDIGRGFIDIDVNPKKIVLNEAKAISKTIIPENEFMTKKTPVNGIYMEACGQYKGAMTYFAKTDSGKDLLMKGAADIVQVWENNIYYHTCVAGGEWLYYVAKDSDFSNSKLSVKNEWRIRTESWGHSNFDDPRLPSMRIVSSKGIKAAYQVNKVDCTQVVWRFHLQNEWIPDELTITVDRFDPILNPNAWNSTKIPLIASYTTEWKVENDSDSFAIGVESPSAETAVYINNHLVGVFNLFDPWLDLSEWVNPGETVQLTLLCRKRHWEEKAGTPSLYQLKKLDPEIIGSSDEELKQKMTRLLDGLKEAGTTSESEELAVNQITMLDMNPLFKADYFITNTNICVESTLQPGIGDFVPGETKLVIFNVDDLVPACLNLRIVCLDAKVTGFFNGHILGRIFGNSECQPSIVGGDPEVLYIPKPWFVTNNNTITLLIESIGTSTAIHSITLEE